MRPLRADWEAGQGFPLDRFQRDALDGLDRGRSVLVAAPTGAGKTLVADYAVDLALADGRRIFYTSPIKALSNQKYRDLGRRLGSDQVGLLTGDNSVNGDAPVVVMTTEVLRNMIYAGRTDLGDLEYVVLDEVHYLQDTYRGPVWEEVIINLPAHVGLVCLSATVSNAGELAEWIETVRGPTSVVVEERRPVELDHLYLVGDRTSERSHLLPILVDGRPNPEGERFDRAGAPTGRGGRQGGRNRGGRPRSRYHTPRRLEVIDVLAEAGLLPAIMFIFSRAACDDAVSQCLDAGVRLTGSEERARVRAIVDEHTGELGDRDLAVLGHDRWVAALEAGIAGHHAGMIPPFKEAVEHCFVEGLVKLVFATETLALGVNMPARAVVIERMTKFNGETREFLTPSEYTQLTGRAGRRGIDERGAAVVLWSPHVEFGRIAGLAQSRSFVLRSAFRPTYNMAANLVRRHDATAAHDLLTRSFAQFQADRTVVSAERRLVDRRAVRDRLLGELGDRGEVEQIRQQEREVRERRHAARWQVEATLEQLAPGTVIELDDGEPAVVLSTAHRKGGAVRVRVVRADKATSTLNAGDFDEPPRLAGQVDLPRPFTPKDPAFRAAVAEELARFPSGAGRQPAGSSGPVIGPDDEERLRLLARVERIERDIAQLERRVSSRSGSLVRQLDRVLQIMEHWGYLEGWSLTHRGEMLTRIYHEADLLVTEAVAAGLFDDLGAPEVAAVASLFTYEHRSPGPPPPPRWPSRAVREAADGISTLSAELDGEERALGLSVTRAPDPGFADLAHDWAAGQDLHHLLDEEELSGGDFVRNVRQLVDLLRQIGHVAPERDTRRAARQAAEALDRGVVAASSALTDPDGEGVGES